MRALLFIVGCLLVAAVMGTPEGIPSHSGSAKSPLAFVPYWLISTFGEWAGKYGAVLIGLAMVALSFWPKKHKKDE
jgi:hypothetical protein